MSIHIRDLKPVRLGIACLPSNITIRFAATSTEVVSSRNQMLKTFLGITQQLNDGQRSFHVLFLIRKF